MEMSGYFVVVWVLALSFEIVWLESQENKKSQKGVRHARQGVFGNFYSVSFYLL